jgi:hypothetical protein
MLRRRRPATRRCVNRSARLSMRSRSCLARQAKCALGIFTRRSRLCSTGESPSHRSRTAWHETSTPALNESGVADTGWRADQASRRAGARVFRHSRARSGRAAAGRRCSRRTGFSRISKKGGVFAFARLVWLWPPSRQGGSPFCNDQRAGVPGESQSETVSYLWPVAGPRGRT